MSGKNKTKARRFRLMAALAAALIVGGLFVMRAHTSPNTDRQYWPATFLTDGEALYFTGRSLSGSQLIPRGGNHHMTMMGAGGCADCHGSDRKGGWLWPTPWQVAPSITELDLTGGHAHDDHNHDGYTSETLADAITRGIRPDGSRIDRSMPRWSASEADLDALTAFLLKQ